VRTRQPDRVCAPTAGPHPTSLTTPGPVPLSRPGL